jgi:hypothetical protein
LSHTEDINENQENIKRKIERERERERENLKNISDTNEYWRT